MASRASRRNRRRRMQATNTARPNQAQAPPDVPAQAPPDVPAQAPPDVPAQAPPDVPAQAPPDVPAQAPTQPSGQLATGDPADNQQPLVALDEDPDVAQDADAVEPLWRTAANVFLPHIRGIFQRLMALLIWVAGHIGTILVQNMHYIIVGFMIYAALYRYVAPILGKISGSSPRRGPAATPTPTSMPPLFTDDGPSALIESLLSHDNFAGETFDVFETREWYFTGFNGDVSMDIQKMQAVDGILEEGRTAAAQLKGSGYPSLRRRAEKLHADVQEQLNDIAISPVSAVPDQSIAKRSSCSVLDSLFHCHKPRARLLLERASRAVAVIGEIQEYALSVQAYADTEKTNKNLLVMKKSLRAARHFLHGSDESMRVGSSSNGAPHRPNEEGDPDATTCSYFAQSDLHRRVASLEFYLETNSKMASRARRVSRDLAQKLEQGVHLRDRIKSRMESDHSDHNSATTYLYEDNLRALLEECKRLLGEVKPS